MKPDVERGALAKMDGVSRPKVSWGGANKREKRKGRSLPPDGGELGMICYQEGKPPLTAPKRNADVWAIQRTADPGKRTNWVVRRLGRKGWIQGGGGIKP